MKNYNASMCPEKIIAVRCVAEGRGNDWQAICLDFDIAVQGPSFENVYRELNQQIVSYIETVSHYSPEERKSFYNRKAPLLLRLRYMWRQITHYLGSGDSESKEIHSFSGRAVCPV